MRRSFSTVLVDRLCWAGLFILFLFAFVPAALAAKWREAADSARRRAEPAANDGSEWALRV